MKTLLIIAALVLSGASLFATGLLGRMAGEIRKAREGQSASPSSTIEVRQTAVERKPAGGLEDDEVVLAAEQCSAIDIQTAEVAAQTQPIILQLPGRTAYNPDTIIKLRPRFDTRVERVFAALGTTVKKGDPLVELYSTDLAAAKSNYQMTYVQWQHDLKLLTLRDRLLKDGAVSLQLFVDTQNSEQKSRLDFNLALDRLAVFYEVPKEEVVPLLVGLSEKTLSTDFFDNVSDKAKMRLRAKSDGIVIDRQVVPGNYYESTDVLMEIAPLDQLWVWASIFELDQDQVKLGQSLRIHFPFLGKTIEGKVEFVASQVDRITKAVNIRASIQNPGGRLKSDMLVQAMLEIPPVPGHVVIPRQAMVVLNGSEFVYVTPSEAAGGKESPAHGKENRFRRQPIEIVQENSKEVVVKSGLKPGERVACRGSLILSQIHEDQRVAVTGQP